MDKYKNKNLKKIKEDLALEMYNSKKHSLVDLKILNFIFKLIDSYISIYTRIIKVLILSKQPKRLIVEHRINHN